MRKICRMGGTVDVKKVLSVLLLALLACAGAFAAGSGDTEPKSAEWPSRTVQIVVPYAAGGDTRASALK